MYNDNVRNQKQFLNSLHEWYKIVIGVDVDQCWSPPFINNRFFPERYCLHSTTPINQAGYFLMLPMILINT